jgi:hypothetical protein
VDKYIALFTARTQKLKRFSTLFYKYLRRNVLLYLRSSVFICGFGLPGPVIYAETSARIERVFQMAVKF